MPARYLLIEFDDEAQAEALRAQINAATLKGKKFRVVGMFARPSRWCDCYRTTENYKQWNLQKGAKFGWFVCPECKRPVLQQQVLRNLLDFGDIVGGAATRIARAFHTPSHPDNSVPTPYGLRIDSLVVHPTPVRPKP